MARGDTVAGQGGGGHRQPPSGNNSARGENQPWKLFLVFCLLNQNFYASTLKRLERRIAFGLSVCPSHFLMHAISYEPC